MITVALPKGRLLEDVIDFFQECGLDHYTSELDPKTRSLYTIVGQTKFIYAKGQDVPVYVENGSADIGFIGLDVITENKYDLLNVSRLPFGKCHFSLCGLPDVKEFKTIATSFKNIAFQYFKEQRKQVSIIELKGSVELAPLLGMADGIIDIVETGKTLIANGLIEYEKIMDVQACLIANRQTFYTKEDEIYQFMKEIGIFQ